MLLDNSQFIPPDPLLEKTRDWFFCWLMRRTCTRRDAAEYLKKREIDEDMIETLLAEAEDLRLLNDAAYGTLFAAGHESWGRNRIAFELGRRGLSEDDIQTALEEVDEEERLRALIPSWQKGGLEERKIIARLYRRGFSSRSIRSVWRAIHEENP